jgi:hypothetical protein
MTPGFADCLILLRHTSDCGQDVWMASPLVAVRESVEETIVW